MMWIWFKCTPALESGALLTIMWGLRSLCHFSCSYFLGCFLTPNFHSMTLIFLACKFALVGPFNLSSNLFYLILLRAQDLRCARQGSYHCATPQSFELSPGVFQWLLQYMKLCTLSGHDRASCCQYLYPWSLFTHPKPLSYLGCLLLW